MSRNKHFLPPQKPLQPLLQYPSSPKKNSSPDVTSVLLYIVSSLKCVSLKCMTLFYSRYFFGGVQEGFLQSFSIDIFHLSFLPSNLFAEETSLIFYISFHPDLILSCILVHGDWI